MNPAVRHLDRRRTRAFRASGTRARGKASLTVRPVKCGLTDGYGTGMQDTRRNEIYTPDMTKNRKIFQLAPCKNGNVYYVGPRFAKGAGGLARGAARGQHVIDQ
jgi:hypothetical protein